MESKTELICLQEKIKKLESENLRLKELLDRAGIAYNIKSNEATEKNVLMIEKQPQLSQGDRIRKVMVTEEMAVQFFTLFWGRTDVYSKRYVNNKTGAAGYFPQCENFWRYSCPKREGKKVRCIDCTYKKWKRLGKQQVLEHLQGRKDDTSDVIGVYPLLEDGTCRFIVFDFDNHEKGAEKADYANRDDTWKEEVETLRKICSLQGIDALIERSRSGRGAHVWIFFQKPVPASLARNFGNALLQKGAESVNLKSFTYFDRMLPMQDYIAEGSLGNLIALPLQGRALLSGNSAFVDEHWNTYPDQWQVLLSKKRLSRDFIEKCIKEWQTAGTVKDLLGNEIDDTDEKPWERSRYFFNEDVEGVMHLTLADAVYIETSNLTPRIQYQIRRLAAFSNPKFYKNQAMGLSNFDQHRFIYMGSDEGRYIRIPRGLKEELLQRCDEAGIVSVIDDERQLGRALKITFCGELKKSQEPALKAMSSYENGILSAATAFGKTVLCMALIAEKKTSTLILLESSALIEQWENALQKFLRIDEELPVYRTASGREKRRKSVIGKIHGAHDSSTGIIDIAMAGSLQKKGKLHERIGDYGMVILDECHHAASQTIINVLQAVKAKYVYGVTATPTRGDGLEKINAMLLGPIRYQYTAKDRAREQGIEHLVYPRFTRATVPVFQQEKVNVNEMYELVRSNPARDALIIEDVENCIKRGRCPVVLSRFKDHSLRLYEQLKECADKVFLLTGIHSKKEQKAVIEQMQFVKPEETMILIATGQLIGEGFDYPRLDTLMMATPVSGSQVVTQYAGRLNRDYEGKKNVIIYDYVDNHIFVFDNMYHKRLKAYKSIGYNVCGTIDDEKQKVNAIYDIENYQETYQRDLIEADKEIIISSPAIGRKKVEEIIALLKPKQEQGVKVIVTTWEPDSYGYGDSSRWTELHGRMRAAGFELNLMSEHCERYVVIDREIVWYGSMNFLGKEDIEDNLMRVCSSDIAAELLELNFENYVPEIIDYVPKL